ncbi:ABC-2 family transporter protein [Nostoc sp. LEGE 12447]|uniref:ABC transporter permease n=1 Tax=Nostoc sp. LEGE 12447 TaxID=1828640 RepID=UPI0018834A47|nr:ABC-2 family transporter protein [Nostoc sp. LEGE 12447]MBE9002339.1 ABC-2 family transporter protein [Nostoc sp. LEGE 12447]
MNHITKYIWIGWTSARSNLAYLGEVASRGVFLFVILYIFLQLWRVTYAETNAKELGNLSLTQMLWYLGITESIVLSAPIIAQEVDEDVRTGTLAVQLIRPLSYPLYRLWTTLGERAVRFGLNLTVSIVIALLFVGLIPLSLPGIFLFLLSLPLAFVLDFLATFLVGLGAFWLENTTGLMLIYSRITMILGGMLIPLDLFPEQWQPVLKNLPFASIVYGPARLFVQPDLVFAGELLLRQAVAIGVLSLLVAWVYSTAVQRIHANGG